MKKKIKNNKNSTCIFCIKCGSMNVPKLELLLMLIEEQDYTLNGGNLVTIIYLYFFKGGHFLQ